MGGINVKLSKKIEFSKSENKWVRMNKIFEL